jgi:hypothetical protein
MKKEKIIKLLDLMEVLEGERESSTPEKEYENGKIKIAVLQRGHVAIGRFYRDGYDCRLENSYIIRRWGTERGLGQLALEGKTSDTILDKTGVMHFDYLTVVYLTDCVQELWEKELKD